MNILTKISVVVLVLLVLAFCPVVLQVATQLPNYKSLFEGEKKHSELLNQEAALKTAEVLRAQAELTAAKNDEASAESKLITETSALTKQLNEEKARSAAQGATLTSMDLTMKQFEQDVKAKEDRNVKLVAALEAERAEVNKKTDEIRRLGDALNKQTLDAETARHQADFLREQLAQAEEKLRNAENAMSHANGVGVAPVTENNTGEPPVEIWGTITAVNRDIASINIGQAKGVRKGDIAVVSRGADYVGRLQIQDVDQNQAAGLIVSKKLDPAPGDKIEISRQR